MLMMVDMALEVELFDRSDLLFDNLGSGAQ